MAKLTPEDLEFIAMLDAKAKANKHNAFMEKARIARERRNSRLEAKRKNKPKSIEQKIVNEIEPINQEIEPNNYLEVEDRNESINNQQLENKDTNQEVTIVNENEPINNRDIEPNNYLKIEDKNESINNQQLEDKNVNQEVTIVNEIEPINQEIEPNNYLEVEDKNESITNQQLEDKNTNKEVTNKSEHFKVNNQSSLNTEDKEVLIKDYLTWISITLQSKFYVDNQGNIPINWQQLAKENYQRQFTNNDDFTQGIIEQAIARLDNEDKLMLNQILTNEFNLVDKSSPVINFDDSLPCDEYLQDPEIEQEFYQDDTEDNLPNQEEIKTAELDNNSNTPDTFNQAHSDSLPIKSDNNQINSKPIEVSNEVAEANENLPIKSDNNQINSKPVEVNHITEVNENLPIKSDNSQINSKPTEVSNQINENNENLSIKADKNKSGYKLIEDNEELKNEIALLTNQDILAIDTETTGLDPHIHKIRLIQIASENHPTILIDCFKCDAKLIQPLLINSSIKVFHNAKFDLQFFFALGLEVNQSIFDTMIANQLLTAGNNNVKSSLKAIASNYLKIELNKNEQISHWKSDKLSDSQLEYAVKDAEVLLPLREKLREEIINHQLTTVAKIEFDCIHAVAMMEFNGMLLDVGKWQEILTEAVKRKEELAQQLQQLLPQENSSQLSLDFTIFNYNNNQGNNHQLDSINSNSSNQLSNSNNQSNFNQFGNINLDSAQQLLEALNRAGIDCKNTKSQTLKKLLPQYPQIIKPLLEYKKLTKIISSFGDGLLKKINPVTGRLHGSYWQLNTQSGRFTSNNPNLQQIPRNKETRTCFVATPNHKLVSFLYSNKGLII